MKYLFSHGHLIVDGQKEYLDGAILVDGERIVEIYPHSNKLHDLEKDYEEIDLKGALVMPGFFDTHTHGINDISFDTADGEQMDQTSLEFAKSGTTSYTPSLSYDCETADFPARFALMENHETPYCRFHGFHIEGPFLSTSYLGVANPEKLLKPDMNLIKDILDRTSLIKQMTIAYELEGAKEVGKYLHDHGVKVMVGHSDARHEDLDENVDGFTHLFNAMKGLHHREVTLVNTAFMNEGYYCELITDGYHIDRNVLKLAINNIDKDHIIIVSDSSTARGLEDGPHVFLSKNCIKTGTIFKTLDGHFAGSVVSINDEMKVLHELGASYTDLLRYSSLNAFTLYGLDSQFGTLTKGKFADLAIMDDDLNIKNVYVQGKFIYE